MNLEQENKRLRAENAQVRQLLEEALQKIKDLEARLKQHSQNSNWPSSRDLGKKKKPKKSLRRKSGQKPGGQKGHQGKTLEFVAEPDTVSVHRPDTCQHCAEKLSPDVESVAVQKRQVHDLPPVKIEVTEHQVETVECPSCGGLSHGEFPETVTNPVQYGSRIKQLALYLKHQQLIPYDRVRQLLSDLFELSISPGSLQNFTRKAAKQLSPIMDDVKDALVQSPVIHVDESGFYIGGERHWLHVTSTNDLTYYYPHRQRGRKAFNALGILPKYEGRAIHDHFSSYWGYDCDHGLCNVHHLRELHAVTESDKQPWSQRMATLLLRAKHRVDQAKADGKTALDPDKLAQIDRVFNRLIAAAIKAYPPPETGWPRGSRGCVKKPKPLNLAERLAKRKSEVLAFVHDFKVPFDNNLAERDIRMLKVQQKISGCFRSQQGAEDFCHIRGYISTMRKQGFNVWDALGSVFTPQVLRPKTPV